MHSVLKLGIVAVEDSEGHMHILTKNGSYPVYISCTAVQTNLIYRVILILAVLKSDMQCAVEIECAEEVLVAGNSTSCVQSATTCRRSYIPSNSRSHAELQFRNNDRISN